MTMTIAGNHNGGPPLGSVWCAYGQREWPMAPSILGHDVSVLVYFFAN